MGGESALGRLHKGAGHGDPTQQKFSYSDGSPCLSTPKEIQKFRRVPVPVRPDRNLVVRTGPRARPPQKRYILCITLTLDHTVYRV